MLQWVVWSFGCLRWCSTWLQPRHYGVPAAGIVICSLHEHRYLMCLVVTQSSRCHFTLEYGRKYDWTLAGLLPHWRVFLCCDICICQQKLRRVVNRVTRERLQHYEGRPTGLYKSHCSQVSQSLVLRSVGVFFPLQVEPCTDHVFARWTQSSARHFVSSVLEHVDIQIEVVCAKRQRHSMADHYSQGGLADYDVVRSTQFEHEMSRGVCMDCILDIELVACNASQNCTHGICDIIFSNLTRFAYWKLVTPRVFVQVFRGAPAQSQRIEPLQVVPPPSSLKQLHYVHWRP